MRLVTANSTNWDNEFDALVRGAFAAQSTRGFAPAELRLEGDDAVVALDLPGITIENINVRIEDGVLIVSGERPAASPGDARVIHSELRTGTFTRTFRLPRHVDPAAVSANIECGVLTIRVPAAATRPSTQIPVTVSDTSAAASLSESSAS